MEDGQVMNPSRLDYKMPRAFEMSEADHIIVETINPNGPFGAKEVGEGPIVCPMQAIANAVADAIGKPVREMPLSPWRVLRLIDTWLWLLCGRTATLRAGFATGACRGFFKRTSP